MLIQFNQYPENYEEEKMPQVVIEIRYRKGQKTEANKLAQKFLKNTSLVEENTKQ